MMKSRALTALASLALFGLVACGGGGGSGSGGSAGGSAAAGSTAGGGTTGGSTGGASVLPTGLWLKGDLHSHSSPYSQDAKKQLGDDVQTCIRLAEVTQLDFWALTDHRTIDGHKDAGFRSNSLLLLPGMEWGSGDHANPIGITTLKKPVDKTKSASTWNAQVQAVVDETHKEGGIFIINHPTGHSGWRYDIAEFDGIEVWNSFWGFMANEELTQAVATANGAEQRAAGSQPTGALDYAASFRVPKREQAVKFWEYYLNRGVRVAATGGGDRHMLVKPGYPTTWVMAKDRSQASVYRAIQQGRVYVTGTPDGPKLRFTADANDDGTQDTMIGGQVAVGKPVSFEVELDNAIPGEVVIVKNGKVFTRWPYQSLPAKFRFSDIPKKGDWWRVDVYETIDMTTPDARRLHAVATSKSLRGGNFKDPNFYITMLNLIGSLSSIRTTRSWGTLLPTIDWTRDQARILHVDPLHPSRSRAVLSSPIYAR